MKSFYVTTPLYYVNDKPHLGSAYTTIVCDVLARYHKLFGRDVLFLTGTDEHGQKVEQAAKKRNKAPQEHCDEMSEAFKGAWKELNIEYDIFFRTTNNEHKKTVQSILKDLWDKGEIYADTYEGWYSVSEEIFYTEKELIDGKTPTGNEVQKITEKNYFFKMSKYQEPLIAHIENNPGFIRPESRKNEVLGFLKKPLADLCISRPKARLSWGIELPFDKDYVTYVWFDALLNYANGVGLYNSEQREHFDKWWQEGQVTHLLGKDILITHSVYWPTMLMAIGVSLPKTLFAHGWILNRDNEKMSKSKGSVMDPKETVKWAGVDPLRYFLIHDIHLGNDAPVSQELIAQRINNDLANNLGNLLSRSTNLISKFFDGKAPGDLDSSAFANEIKARAIGTATKVQSLVESYELSKALEEVIQLLNEANKYLEDKAPWKVAKTDLNEAGKSLSVALEVLRIAAGLLLPVMPEKCASLLETIGQPKEPSWKSLSEWGVIAPGTEIEKAKPLFPRIDLKEQT